MQELIKIETNENGEPIVNARELHERLENKRQFSDWIKQRIEQYGFMEDVDFTTFHNFVKREGSNLGSKTTEYALTLDTAKEIAMVENNEQGRKIRKYFIQVEKDFNSPEKVMARALKYAEQKLSVLQLENTQQKQIIGELKPKADYLDKILQSKALVTITAIAKDYGMSAKELNKKLHNLKIQFKQGHQWFLYSKYHDCGYTHSETIEYKHKDGTLDTTMNTKWTQKGRLFLYDILKKNGIVPIIEK